MPQVHSSQVRLGCCVKMSTTSQRVVNADYQSFLESSEGGGHVLESHERKEGKLSNSDVLHSNDLPSED